MFSKKKRILVSITGKTPSDWKNKLKEIEKLKIEKVALFLEFYNSKQKKEIYEALLNSKIKKIPFVHIRNDMSINELKFLRKNFRTKYFNIHENSFQYLDKWRGFHKRLLVEFNYNNKIPHDVVISRVRGFCIDLSHFMSAKERGTKEYLYIMKRKEFHKYFKANHLNGYSPKRKRDLHTIRTLKDFDYLKTLPKFLFGKYIALETFNPIKEQLKFRDYVYELIKDKL